MPTSPLSPRIKAGPGHLERQGWGLVLSAWAHILGVGVLLLLPERPPEVGSVAPQGHVLLVDWLAPDEDGSNASDGRRGSSSRTSGDTDAVEPALAGPLAHDDAPHAPRLQAAPSEGSAANIAPPQELTAEEGSEDQRAAAPEEEEEPPSVEPPPAPLEFVMSESDVEAPEQPPDTEVHSARNRSATELRRALATADPLGRHNPRPTGIGQPGGEQVLRESPGDAPDRMGTQSPTADLWSSGMRGGGGGGKRATSTGTGGSSQHGDATEGGRAAAAARGGAGRRASGSAGIAEALAGAPLRELTSPELWRPSAMRWTLPAANSNSTPTLAAATSPTSGARLAVRERPGRAADRGGRDASDVDVAHAGPTALIDVEGLGDSDSEGYGDIVNDLREALGWGGIDRSKLAVRRPSFGPELPGSGEQATSRNALIAEHYDLADIAFVAAKETPEGHYLEEVTTVVNARWSELDLSLDDRARGIGGNVVVLFRVHRNGKVEDVLVERSSGNVDLDRLALSAVPERLPRFPKDLEHNQLVHRMHFRYDNPFIAVDATPRP